MKILDKVEKIAKANLHLPESRFKHFSFITQRNKIICWGFNQAFKTHPLALKFGHRFNCIHSEIDVIKKFPYPLKYICNYQFINIRIMSNGTCGNAKPCVRCLSLLNHFGISDIIYSTKRGFSNGTIYY